MNVFCISVLLVGIAVIIYGVRANIVYHAGGENGVNTFNWAFYVGVIGAGFAGLGTLFYLWGSYRIKKWEKKHYARIGYKEAMIGYQPA